MIFVCIACRSVKNLIVVTLKKDPGLHIFTNNSLIFDRRFLLKRWLVYFKTFYRDPSRP